MTGSAANCRENASPVKLFPKIHKDVLENGLWLNISLFATLLCGTLFSLQSLVSATGPLIPRVLSSIAWPPFFVMIISTFYNHWTPIGHLLNPPVYPSRASGLMVTESKVPYSSANIKTDHIYKVSMFDRTLAFGLPSVLLGMLAGVLTL